MGALFALLVSLAAQEKGTSPFGRMASRIPKHL